MNFFNFNHLYRKFEIVLEHPWTPEKIRFRFKFPVNFHLNKLKSKLYLRKTDFHPEFNIFDEVSEPAKCSLIFVNLPQK